MSVTFSVPNSEEMIKKELVTEEQREAWDDWKNKEFYGNQEESFRAWKKYEEYIIPIENKYEVNMTNGRVKELFELLGFKFDYCGSFKGVVLEEFKVRLKKFLKLVESNPVEFSTPTMISGGGGRATVIDVGTCSEYWKYKGEQLLELAEKTEELCLN